MNERRSSQDHHAVEVNRLVMIATRTDSVVLQPGIRTQPNRTTSHVSSVRYSSDFDGGSP